MITYFLYKFMVRKKFMKFLKNQFQLNLINNYISEELKPLQMKEEDLIRELRENSSLILALKEEAITSDLERLELLGSYREELNRIGEAKVYQSNTNKENYDQEEHLLTQADNQISDVKNELNSLQASLQVNIEPYQDENIAELPNEDVLKEQRDILEESIRKSINRISLLEHKISESWEEGRDARDIWQEKYDNQDKAYQKLLKEFQESDGVLDPDRYIQLQRRVTKLEEISRETENKTKRIDKLNTDRAELLDKLQKIRRFSMNCAVKRLNIYQIC